jgi:hypothetical protein
MNKLVEYVVGYTTEWSDHRDENYLEDWKEYERLWRGIWAAEDSTRSSERSRITSPALQQAIENHSAEIEEAVFGQGEHLFELEDAIGDDDPVDVEFIQQYMKESFKKNKLRKAVGDIILLGSIYGTGIGEIITKKVKEFRPTTRPMEGADTREFGVEEVERVVVTLRAISPQNFIIDPNATTIEDAMGVAVEEFVSAHSIAQKVKEGVYLKTDIEDDSTPDIDLEPTWIDTEYNEDKVHVIRYYGLVPAKLLKSQGEGEIENLLGESESDLMEEYGDLVEAIIVIGNNKLLKAEANPYMMKDRPIVAFQDDTVPNRFYGRGIAEKGYNMQKAIDAQLRSHLDSLALTSVPMMAMDATRLPRGSKFEVRPGKTILTNGNPAEILLPFKFGTTDPSNIDIANKFEGMLLQATGTLDSQGMQAIPAGGGEMSIALSSIIKKNKRTLVNFQDNFLIPFIEKAAFRFMQFDPDNFPVKDYTFVASSSLGILAREVEQMQMINLMKTLGPDSPIVPILIQGVISNSSLPNKQALLAQLQESMKPNPEAQQAQQMQQQLQAGLITAQTNDLNSKAGKQQAEAQQTMVETQYHPQEVQAKLAAALSNNLDAGEADDKEFARRAKISELMFKEKELTLKEKDMDQNFNIVQMQMADNKAKDDSFNKALG